MVMTRAVMIPGLVAVAAAMACAGGGGKDKDTTVDDRPPLRATVSWGMSPAPPKGAVATRTEVFLAVTDEMGRQVSYPLGIYDGACVVLGPLAQYSAMTAISCMNAGAGFQLHAGNNRTEIVVMRMAVRDGVEPDPLARDHVTTVPVPLGAKIEAAKP